MADNPRLEWRFCPSCGESLKGKIRTVVNEGYKLNLSGWSGCSAWDKVTVVACRACAEPYMNKERKEKLSRERTATGLHIQNTEAYDGD